MIETQASATQRVFSNVSCSLEASAHLNELDNASDKGDAFEYRRTLARETVGDKPENGAHQQECHRKNDALDKDRKVIDRANDPRRHVMSLLYSTTT